MLVNYAVGGAEEEDASGNEGHSHCQEDDDRGEGRQNRPP